MNINDDIDKLNISNDIKELIKNKLSKYNVTENAQYQLIQDSDEELHYCADNLYFTLINVCVLKDIFPQLLRYWKYEIYKSTYQFILPKLKHTDHIEFVKKYMIEPTVGRNFEYYNVEQFIAAMKYEIDKANKCSINTKIRLKEIKYINILLKDIDDINEIVLSQKDRIADFYINFLYAVESKSEYELLNAIDMFVENI